MCALRANRRLPCLLPECTAAAGPTLRGIPPGTVSNGVCYLRALTAEDRPHCRHRRSCSCLVGTTPGTLHARTTRRSGLPLSTHMGLLGVSANMGHSVHSAGATQTTQIGGTHTRVLVYEYHADTRVRVPHGYWCTHMGTPSTHRRYSKYSHGYCKRSDKVLRVLSCSTTGTPHGIPPWCAIHHMVPGMGHSECPHGAHAGTSSPRTHRTHTRVRGTRVRVHTCA